MIGPHEATPHIDASPAQGEFCKCCGGEDDVWLLSIGYILGGQEKFAVRALLCRKHRGQLYGELGPSL